MVDGPEMNSHCDLTWVRLQLERMDFCFTFISLINRRCRQVPALATLLCHSSMFLSLLAPGFLLPVLPVEVECPVCLELWDIFTRGLEGLDVPLFPVAFHTVLYCAQCCWN